MAIKKRNVASNETPNEKSVDEKEYLHEVELDAFDRALAKASENRRRVKEVQVKEKKAEPKVEVGQYIAITTDAQLESNIETKYGRNERITVFFELFLNDDYQESILLTEKFLASANEGSRYYQILSGLLQRDARQGFHIRDLIGIPCEVTIIHNETPKGIYANIGDLQVIDMEED